MGNDADYCAAICCVDGRKGLEQIRKANIYNNSTCVPLTQPSRCALCVKSNIHSAKHIFLFAVSATSLAHAYSVLYRRFEYRELPTGIISSSSASRNS